MKNPTWERFTQPHSIAVIGASDKVGSVGGAILSNLSLAYKGQLYPINPKRDSVLGRKAYPSLAETPSPVDLAVIATPAPTIPDVIIQCGEAGVKAAIVVSAGFEEAGDEGRKLMQHLRKAARAAGVRVLGPNCVGLICPRSGVNATFAANMPEDGTVAFISQSGALGTAIADWTASQKIGLSTFVSIGSMVDVGWSDLLYFLGDDPHTQSIVIYMESIGDARSFLSAAREIALQKPIIVLKAGRHEEGARAAMSHTGSMAGSDEVLDAAFDRCGVLRVKTIAELFYMAEVLSKQPRPRGPRMTVVTNAGGPGVLAVDALVDEGGSLAELAPETMKALDEVLPPSWSKNNPIDVLGDASPERYCKALELALNDPNTDSVLTILTPQAMTDPTATAAAVAAMERPRNKPLLASWMGGDRVTEGSDVLKAASIPCFPYPDTAARIAQYTARYGETLKNLYETPQLLKESESFAPDRERVGEIVAAVRASGRSIMTEYESKRLMQAYGIPTVDTWVAVSAAEAVEAAKRVGFPVVLKVNSETVTHKRQAGGVILDVNDEASVRKGYRQIEESITAYGGASAFQGVTVQPMVRASGCELIIGSRIDPQFGPVLLFGAGGRFAEVMGDFALALPPLNTTLAMRMMKKTRLFKAVYGPKSQFNIPVEEIEQLLIVFSQLVLENPSIAEIEINPLLVSDYGLTALDARVVVATPEAEAHVRTAIKPYPDRYVDAWTTGGGVAVTIRPIRPEDEPAMVRLHGRLSDQTVYNRFFTYLALGQRVAHDRLSRLCFIDYDRQMALVVETLDPETGKNEIVAVGRLMRQGPLDEAEFAVLVADGWQDQGLGTELLRRLLAYASDMNVRIITADILPDNRAMQRVCEKLGFKLERDPDAHLVTAVLTAADAVPGTANQAA